MMNIAKFILVMALTLMMSAVLAEERSYLFDIKLFDITDVADGLQKYQTLEPFSNPKMITYENKPALMELSGTAQEELYFKIEVIAKSQSKFNIKFEVFKGKQLISGPTLTEGFSSDKTWLMVTNFDKRKLIVTVDMKEVNSSGT
jgi:hypothetical protein